MRCAYSVLSPSPSPPCFAAPRWRLRSSATRTPSSFHHSRRMPDSLAVAQSHAGSRRVPGGMDQPRRPPPPRAPNLATTGVPASPACNISLRQLHRQPAHTHPRPPHGQQPHHCASAASSSPRASPIACRTPTSPTTPTSRATAPASSCRSSRATTAPAPASRANSRSSGRTSRAPEALATRAIPAPTASSSTPNPQHPHLLLDEQPVHPEQQAPHQLRHRPHVAAQRLAAGSSGRLNPGDILLTRASTPTPSPTSRTPSSAPRTCSTTPLPPPSCSTRTAPISTTSARPSPPSTPATTTN